MRVLKKMLAHLNFMFRQARQREEMFKDFFETKAAHLRLPPLMNNKGQVVKALSKSPAFAYDTQFTSTEYLVLPLLSKFNRTYLKNYFLLSFAQPEHFERYKAGFAKRLFMIASAIVYSLTIAKQTVATPLEATGVRNVFEYLDVIVKRY